jgi:hypothetical protein
MTITDISTGEKYVGVEVWFNIGADTQHMMFFNGTVELKRGGTTVYEFIDDAGEINIIMEDKVSRTLLKPVKEKKK